MAGQLVKKRGVMQVQIRSRWLKAAVSGALAWAAQMAEAQAMAHFDIPAQPLADSLRAVGSQTSTNILFDPPLVAGLQAPAVNADLTTDQAISHLLSGTGIRYRFLNDTTVVLDTTTATDGAPVPPPAAPSAQEGKTSSSDRFRLAQVDQGAPAGAAPVEPHGVDATGGPPGTRTADEQQNAQADQFTEVVVTGSRVIREGMSSPTPVTSLSADELLQANPQSIVQGLAELPAFAASTTPKSIGGRTTLGPGNYLNLRDLGPSRNLVLLDGRRVVPSNVAGYVDINLLPQSLISNVSVVTGGASAAYGSDAVAGVTNFILNTRYRGFKADVSAGTSAHGDGNLYKASFAWGAAFLDDRLHFIGSFDWRHSEEAFAGNRLWAGQHCALIPLPGVNTTNQSANHPRQTIACNVTQSNSAYGGAIISGPLVTSTQGISFGAGGVPQNFIYGADKTANLQIGGTGNPAYVSDTVNFITPVDNKALFGHLTYNLSDSVQAFVQLTASRTASDYNQTPAVLNGSTPLTLFSGNPYIPASIQARMTQGNIPSFALNLTAKSWGLIQADSAFQSYDAVTGLEGKFGGSWSWDAHYEHGRTLWRMTLPNQISWERLYRAVDAVTGPNGTVSCESALIDPSRYGNCVPLNPFGTGAPAAAALDYIRGNPLVHNVMTQDDAAVDINGEPFSLWAGPISFGAGVEWRRLEGLVQSDLTSHSMIDFTAVRGVPPSLLTQVGGWTTTNQLPAGGAYHVTEGFMEVLVPLAKELPFAQALDLNAAVRYTNYSQSGSVETWKVGTTWRPISELLLRLTRSRDIRAPGISDLYSGLTVSPHTVVVDRLNGDASVSVPTGLSGNAHLTPEKANTFTVGGTYEPTWLPDSGFSIDYYDIKIADVLASVSAQETIDRCAQGETQFCNELQRDGVGNLQLILLPTLNLSQARTRGLDLEGNYRTQLPWGAKLSVRGIGTRLLEQSTTVPTSRGSVYSDRTGDMTLGNPKWLVNLLTNYDQGPFGADIVARYVGPGIFNTTYITGDLDSRYTHIPSTITFDLGLHYHMDSVPGGLELYFNVQNVMDRNPPLVPSNALAGFETNAMIYDTMGRFYSGGLRMQF